MKPTPRHACCAALLLAALASTAGWAAPPARQGIPGTNVVPLIVLDNVPLIDAIRNLARQAGLNIIIDPRVPGASSGRGAPEPSVSFRATNQTAPATLDNLLNERHLTIITNPANPVLRIAPATLVARPGSASQIGADTNETIPLIVLDDAPLPAAIQQFASQAHLNVLLDPRVAESEFARQTTVSVRWEKVTARQALAALLDNYDLVLVEHPATRSARITFNPEAPPRR